MHQQELFARIEVLKIARDLRAQIGGSDLVETANRLWAFAMPDGQKLDGGCGCGDKAKAKTAAEPPQIVPLLLGWEVRNPEVGVDPSRVERVLELRIMGGVLFARIFEFHPGRYEVEYNVSDAGAELVRSFTARDVAVRSAEEYLLAWAQRNAVKLAMMPESLIARKTQ